MPTSPSEVRAMMNVIDRYVGPNEAELCFRELDEKVGSKSDNLSFKLSTLMLKTIYATDGRTLEQKMEELDDIFKSYYKKAVAASLVGRTILMALVVSHFALIFGIVASLFVLPFAAKWYIALPLMIHTVNLIATRGECAVTNFENAIRRKLGMPEIRGFIRHYIVKPLVRYRGR